MDINQLLKAIESIVTNYLTTGQVVAKEFNEIDAAIRAYFIKYNGEPTYLSKELDTHRFYGRVYMTPAEALSEMELLLNPPLLPLLSA